MEENFSMEWKIFSMEWKWNGRKLSVWNMEKSSSIPFHTMPLPTKFKTNKQDRAQTCLRGVDRFACSISLPI